MEKVTLDPAIKFGAGRYRQEKNLLEECGKEISRFGKRAFVIAGNRAWDAVKERMIPGFEAAGLGMNCICIVENVLMKLPGNMLENAKQKTVMR